MSYLEAKQRYHAAREEMKETAKPFFEDGIRDIFAEFPDLVSFGWRQYTPYYHDGDAGIFCAYIGADDISFSTGGDDEDDAAYWRIYSQLPEDGPYDKFLIPGMEYQASILWCIVKFLGIFEEETFLDMFGAAATITVRRSKISVQEYDYDQE